MSQAHPDGAVLALCERRWIGEIVVARPAKRNAFTPKMLAELATAFTELDARSDVRALLLHAQGSHFTGGLDLGRMSESGMMGKPLFPAGSVDPVGLFGAARTKPLIMAVEGFCYTLGIELALAADIVVAGRSARFAQLEVQRSVLPYAGATIRMPQRFGWGNAMRYLLTGDEFDAEEAYRVGLVQEVAEPGHALEAALAIADRIAAAAPLAVQGVLSSSRTAFRDGEQAAVDALMPAALKVAQTRDAAEAVAAFRERRAADFTGN